MTNDKDSAEYIKLLNEVVTLRWKCGDQAAEIATLRQPTQTDALKMARDALEAFIDRFDSGSRTDTDYVADLVRKALAALQDQCK
jgi:cell division protein FtsB